MPSASCADHVRVRPGLPRVLAVQLVLDQVGALADRAVGPEAVHADAAAGVVGRDEEPAGAVDGQVGWLGAAGLAAAKVLRGDAVLEPPGVHLAVVGLGDRVQDGQFRVPGHPGR